jgi:hypothetical protein
METQSVEDALSPYIDTNTPSRRATCSIGECDRPVRGSRCGTNARIAADPDVSPTATSFAVGPSLSHTDQPRSRGRHDSYLHLRRLFQHRRLRLVWPRRRLGRLLGQAGPRAARPPPCLVRPRAADGARRHHVPAVRTDAGRELRGVRGARPLGHADEEHAGRRRWCRRRWRAHSTGRTRQS